LFYAAVHFTPNDPAWPDFITLNQYVARCQSFLQTGKPDNDILLYYPLYDSWSQPGNVLLKHYDRMDPEFTGTGFSDCAEFLQNRGYTFEYIADKQLQATEAGKGGIVTGGVVYQAILLPDCRYLSVGALKRLVGLASHGVKVLVYKRLPDQVPGWGGLEQREAQFKALLSGNQFLVSDNLDSLMALGRVRRETLVDDSLGFVRRKSGSGEVYFLVNEGSESFAGYLPLNALFRSAAIFDPMTGNKGFARRRGGSVYLQLRPGETCLVQTNPAGQAAGQAARQMPLLPYYLPLGGSKRLTGAWHLEFLSGGPSIPHDTTIHSLGSWTDLGQEDMQDFSGVAKYSLDFDRPEAGGGAQAWLLELGKIDRTAEVFLNGQKIATLLGPDYEVIIPAAAIHARNTLEIKVANAMVNRIEYMDRRHIPWKKFYNYNFPAHARANRGADGLFDTSRWAPMDSGLSGPVTLLPLRLLP
jgi:hypothetical protein